MPSAPSAITPAVLRRTVLVVAALNLAYFVVEAGVALTIGSVSLFADSVDFLEDTAVNLLIALALGWSLHARSLAGRAMAAIICVPALAAAWQAFTKVSDPQAPDVRALLVTAGGAILVNTLCTWVLARIRAVGQAWGLGGSGFPLRSVAGLSRTSWWTGSTRAVVYWCRVRRSRTRTNVPATGCAIVCCSTAASCSWASLIMPSESSASPMRTIGILA